MWRRCCCSIWKTWGKKTFSTNFSSDKGCQKAGGLVAYFLKILRVAEQKQLAWWMALKAFSLTSEKVRRPRPQKGNLTMTSPPPAQVYAPLEFPWKGCQIFHRSFVFRRRSEINFQRGCRRRRQRAHWNSANVVHKFGKATVGVEPTTTAKRVKNTLQGLAC